MTTTPPDTRPKRRGLKIAGGLLALLLLIVGTTVAYLGVNTQRAVNKATNGKGGSVGDVLLPGRPPSPRTGKQGGVGGAGPSTSAGPNTSAEPGRSATSGTSAEPGASGSTGSGAGTGTGATERPAPSASRVNVLIAGNTADDPLHAGNFLTDGIIVASIDPTTNKTSLISIPRDLWVKHGGERMKINAVYYAGGEGESGMQALSATAEEVTGLPISSYVLVSNKAFKGVIDTVGGIDVVIDSKDPRGISDPNQGLKLPNGPVHLDGDTAFKLASARNFPIPGQEAYGLEDSDFSREQTHQMLLKAIANKIKTTPTLANPVTVVSIFNELADNMHTDLTVSNIKWLYEQQEKQGSPSSIQFKGLVDDYDPPGDAVDAVLPTAGMDDYTAMREHVARELG